MNGEKATHRVNVGRKRINIGIVMIIHSAYKYVLRYSVPNTAYWDMISYTEETNP